ncbi:MAG: hypothetical protein NTX75_00145 [Proteobacteria bacterium]|nr:hypothetical protein [Pseudomonadota bacterium]
MAMLKSLYHLLPTPVRALIRTLIVVTRDYGHYRSFSRNQCLSPQGDPWPWFSYACIFYLERLDFSQCRVLEFGSGGSTKYWARRAKELISVETDRFWHELVKKDLPENARLLFFDQNEWDGCYEKILAMAPFDVVIIDGSWRDRCASVCRRLMAENGLVILDNPDWYPTAHNIMHAYDLIEVSFSGLTPLNARSTTTNVYFPRGFALPFRKDFQFASLPGSVTDNHETQTNLKQ